MELIEYRRRILLNEPHIEKAEGNIITFNTDMAKPLKTCIVGIESTQDLHGQEYPYPAGCWKNIFDCKNFVILYKNNYASAVDTSDDGTGIKITRSYTTSSGNPFVHFDLFEITSAHVGKKYYVSSVYTHTPAYVPALVVLDSDGSNRSRKNYYYTISESDVGRHLGVVFYGSGTPDSVVEYTNIQVEEGTKITDWSPYENVCPIIGGQSNVKMNCTGRNIFNVNDSEFVSDSYYDANGVIKSSSAYRRLVNYIEVKSNKTYSVRYTKSNASSTAVTVPFYDENKNFIQREVAIGQTTSTGSMTGSFTTTSATKYIRFSMIDLSSDIATLQIEEGNTVHDYEPFGALYKVIFPAQGKNLFDQANAAIYERYITQNNNWAYASDSGSYAFKCEPNTDYVVSAFSNDITIFRAGYIESEEIPDRGNIPIYGAIRLTEQGSIQIHTSENATYIVVQVNKALISETPVMIEKGTTASTYEPFDNMVYCGMLDLLTGVFTVTHGYIKLTSSDIQSFGVNSNNIPYMVFNLPSNIAESANVELMCNNYRQSTDTQKDFAIRRATNMYIYDSRITDQQKADELFGTVECVYNYKNPRVFQLTMQQIATIKGLNNIWEDGSATTFIAYWTHY